MLKGREKSLRISYPNTCHMIPCYRLLNKADPFLWKVVFSVPDESEYSSWKDIQTFVEMNFVNDRTFRKEVRVAAPASCVASTDVKITTFCNFQTPPLFYREGCLGTFRYKISIRCLRGRNLYEEDRVNPNATAGCNAIIFVVADDSDFKVSEQRLRSILTSRPPKPQVIKRVNTMKILHI